MQGTLVKLFKPTSNQIPVYHRLSVSLTQQKFSIHKQTNLEKLNIPQKPKRPATPFLRFMAEVRPTLTKEFPHLKLTELVKVAAERWTSVDSRLKEKLKQQYHDESIKYNKEKENYKQSLTPEQHAEIKKAELLSARLKEEKELKKKAKELGKPKQPLTTFFRFLESRSAERNKYPSQKDWIVAASEEWKNISSEVKTKLEEERKLDYQKWVKDLEIWENRMIKEGNIGLVRGSSLRPVLKSKPKK